MRPLLPPALLALAAITACSPSGSAAPATASPSPTYELGPRPARPDERPLKLRPVTDGETTFTALGLTTGLPTLVGSHAEKKARGRYTRIRILAVNTGRTTAGFDARRQALITTDGRRHMPDYSAMDIKRQPRKVPIGAAVRLEFDLWYDLPPSARPASLILYGGASLTDMKDREGAEMKLR